MGESQAVTEDSLRLALSEDGRKLMASCIPAKDGTRIDKTAIEDAVTVQGFGRLFLFDAAVQKLVSQSATATEPFTLEIGEVRDAETKIELAPDRMAAYLSITPAFGGQAANRDRVMQALAEKRITQGILHEEIGRAISAGEVQKLLIAQGRKAVNGEDGRLQSLVDMRKERRPHFDRHDVADYRDLGGIANVREGERIMQRIAPTAGEPGVDVLGQSLPAKPGKDCQFAAQLSGVQIDPEDPNFLVAAISGQPVLVANGMIVEPTLALKTVDLATGNINFEGSISISGDVQPGMSVYASGDIHVGGTVEAASLEAGGDVVVKGGIIGHGEAHEHAKDEHKVAALVRCGGSCSALFVENVKVEAGDSILLGKLARQSELAASNQIVVGQPGSGHGSIIGGFTRATVLVQAGVIGSPAGVKTRVAVGTNPYLNEKLNGLNKEIAQKAKELEDVNKILTFLAENPTRSTPQVRTKAENTRAQLTQDIAQLSREKEDLTQEMNLAEDAKVVIEKTVFSNVQIEIGGKVKKVDIERAGGAYLFKEGEIEFI
ncbi:MAG: DUF342 domain-containing protein [Hydrogenophilaceae bacterium]|nr:DUF342 domain-containing protein [Hydrogenophilaceae bacterium]